VNEVTEPDGSAESFHDPTIVAILPMGFCYSGKGRSGDLPPRPECAPAWRAKLLAGLKKIKLTLVIGAYAQAYHLGARREALADAVAHAPLLAGRGTAVASQPEKQRMVEAQSMVRARIAPGPAGESDEAGELNCSRG
jgi:uracil-DNA glycosylase